jgi:hypothetical protein
MAGRKRLTWPLDLQAGAKQREQTSHQNHAGFDCQQDVDAPVDLGKVMTAFADATASRSKRKAARGAASSQAAVAASQLRHPRLRCFPLPILRDGQGQ